MTREELYKDWRMNVFSIRFEDYLINQIDVHYTQGCADGYDDGYNDGFYFRKFMDGDQDIIDDFQEYGNEEMD